MPFFLVLGGVVVPRCTPCFDAWLGLLVDPHGNRLIDVSKTMATIL